jgi:hypothetical protein
MSIGGTPKKKRGRKPTTGRGRGVQLRLHEPVLGAVDEAARAQGIGKVQVIRRALVEWLKSHGFLHRGE